MLNSLFTHSYRLSISSSFKFKKTQRSKSHRSGLDYTKIVIITKSEYIDTKDALIDKDEFISNPVYAYENTIYAKAAPLKTAVIWNKEFIDEEK